MFHMILLTGLLTGVFPVMVGQPVTGEVQPVNVEGQPATVNRQIMLAAPMLGMSDMAADVEEALTFTKYPTYAQYDSMMHYFATAYPGICRIDTFGRSVEGRLLLALKISDNPGDDEEEPCVLYTSTMHGDELVGYVLNLRLIDFLLSNYGLNAEVDEVVNNLEIWINPLFNPDGAYYAGGDSTVQYAIRNNANGVNLNRNFPDPHANEPDDTTGRQPETKFMMEFMHRTAPNLSANFHSGAEVINYPWDHKQVRHPDTDWYIFISREYADVAHDADPAYMAGDGFTDGITNGYDWYYIYGGRQDYVNYYLHGREVTVELYNGFGVPSGSLEYYWDVNKWSMINYMTQATYGIHGLVTDHENGKPLEAKIWVMDHDNDSSWVVSDPADGRFYRYLRGGVYDLVVTSEGYISDTAREVTVTDYYRTDLWVQLDTAGLRGITDPVAGSLLIYPNPAGSYVSIHTPQPFSRSSSVALYDLAGRAIYRSALPEGDITFSIPLDGWTNGVYVVEVRDGTGTRYTGLLKVGR